MSLLFGEIKQLGYVVRDIEAAMRHWSGTLGVGPWFYLERMPVTNFRYRGQPSAAQFAVALANSGGTQLELIQPRDDHPSMYRDFLRSGRDGLQHVSTWPVDYADTIARAEAAGLVIGQSGESSRGPFAYFETETHGGSVMEIAELTATRKRVFDGIEAAARSWDGRDPVRTVWPS